jgi:hypothetical protein
VCILKDLSSDTVNVIRKIIKVGPRSMAVVLPIEWLEKNSLKPGKSVLLKSQNNVLTILPLDDSNEKSNKDFVNVDYNKLSEEFINVETLILCGLINGKNGIILKNVGKNVEQEILSHYGNILDLDRENDNINIRFIINDLIYNNELLLKHMLGIIVELIDSISQYIEERSSLNEIINESSIEIKKYGYTLARKLLTTYNGIEPSYIINFSTALILGLIGEILLVDAISIKNKEINVEDSVILSRILSETKQVLSDALGGLVYKSYTRAKRAKTRLEKLKKTIKTIRKYSNLNKDCIDQIATLDSILRLTNKLVDMSLCNALEQLADDIGSKKIKK